MQEYIKKVLGSGCSSAPKTTTLIISNDEMKGIIEIVESLEDSGLLLKGISKTIQNESKEQKGELLSTLLGTLGANLFGNIIAGKGMNRAGKGIVRAGYGNKKVRKTTKTKRIFNAASSFKGYLCYKTIFCHKVVFDV